MALRDAKFNLEETKNELKEEKEQSYLSIQKERRKREEIEVLLKQQDEDFLKKQDTMGK